MRIYYIDESEGPRYYVRSALGVNAERWNGLHGRIQDWRTALWFGYIDLTMRSSMRTLLIALGVVVVVILAAVLLLWVFL